jgi:HEAT repeat protein
MGDMRVRRRAAEALGEVGPPSAEAVPAMIAALSDANWEVRRRAFQVVARIGVATVSPLIVALSDAN